MMTNKTFVSIKHSPAADNALYYTASDREMPDLRHIRTRCAAGSAQGCRYMKKMLLGLALSVFAALGCAADVLSLKAGHPQSYVVKQNDTLWAISGLFLEDPWLWPE